MQDIYKKSHIKEKDETLIRLYGTVMKLSEVPTQSIINILKIGEIGSWSKATIDKFRNELRRRNVI